MSEFKDKVDNWLDDAWEVDTFIDEYNYEKKRRIKPLCKEVNRPKKDIRDHFVVKHTGIAMGILAGLVVLSVWCPFFWIAFFAFVFWM